MEIENARYAELIGGQAQDFEGGVRDVLSLTEHVDVIEAHEDRFPAGRA